MTFTEAFIHAGYILDEENFDEGCYVKTDEDDLTHVYQMSEDEGEWNYVKITDQLFDVVEEYTVTVGN